MPRKVYAGAKPGSRLVRSDDDAILIMPTALLPDIVVYCSDPEPVQTGLLGADGHPITYIIVPDPIGFLWHDDEGALVPSYTLEELAEQVAGGSLEHAEDEVGVVGDGSE